MMEKFELMSLPYATDALEPVISRETVALHYGKHLQTYVNNLNGLLSGTEFVNLSLVEIIRKSDGSIFNNAGQVLNHILFFENLRTPFPDNRPMGNIAGAISAQFGSFEAFKKEFTHMGVTLFGSGWVWLSKDGDGKLVISQELNAQNPITEGRIPLLTFDVWEHAYYVDYQNRRIDYLSTIWQAVNWEVVEKRYFEEVQFHWDNYFPS